MSRGVPPSPARDLTMGQIRLLFLLQREGPTADGSGLRGVRTQHALPRRGFVARVERHGLVTRAHRSDDRRVVECDLTQAGRQFVEELSGVRLDVTRQALSALEPSELAEFGGLLRRILERQQRVVSVGGSSGDRSPAEVPPTVQPGPGPGRLAARGAVDRDALSPGTQRGHHQQRGGQGRHRAISSRPAP